MLNDCTACRANSRLRVWNKLKTGGGSGKAAEHTYIGATVSAQKCVGRAAFSCITCKTEHLHVNISMCITGRGWISFIWFTLSSQMHIRKVGNAPMHGWKHWTMPLHIQYCNFCGTSQMRSMHALFPLWLDLIYPWYTSAHTYIYNSCIHECHIAYLVSNKHKDPIFIFV